MPSGYRFPRSTRLELFDRVCQGAPLMATAQEMGGSKWTACQWWREAGAMKLLSGGYAFGLAEPGDLGRPGGRGHRLNLDERIAIMRGRDAG